MKRILALCLLACLAFSLPGGWARGEENVPPALYTGRIRLAARMFASWEGTVGKDQIGSVPAKARVQIHDLSPSFALVTYGDKTGYIKRVCIEDPQVIDAATTPPYGVDFNHFIAFVTASDAPVTPAPGRGDPLITLHQGARVSFIGFENGYGKVIYHRQYGYIDSRLLGEITAVYDRAESAGTDAPIASYTSFYRVTTDESNQNRIVNIGVACQKLKEHPLDAKQDLNFNRDIGPYKASNGYKPATVLIDGNSQQGYGGGTCQVSSTLYNVVLQLPGLTVLRRRAHGANGASYLPIGVDAAVGNTNLNFRFQNDYDFPIRIDASAQDGALTIAIYRTTDGR